VTDSVCSVTKDPPKVIEEDPRALLFHARDSIEDIVVDDDVEAMEAKGKSKYVNNMTINQKIVGIGCMYR